MSDALDLNAGRPGAAPLWLHPDGRLSSRPDGVDEGLAAVPAFVAAARWVSGRRRSTFTRLFPVDPSEPDAPARPGRLGLEAGTGLLTQADGLLELAAVGAEASRADPALAGRARSAALTVLSHLVATRRDDPDFAPLAERAAERMLAMVEAERDPEGAPGLAYAGLRAHGIWLLQLRGPCLGPAQAERARTLLRGLVRAAPPYDDLPGTWNFAMCSAWDFHEGECATLVRQHGFREIPAPPEVPAPPVRWGFHGYRVFEAPFVGPRGEPVRVFARTAVPGDENAEMAMPEMCGLLVNRHAQLGANDLRAAAAEVRQQGWKLLVNSQCAGLTTRFAISRLFPDADIYSSWDSTWFRTAGPGGPLVASEGLDCFVAILRGMAAREDHAALSERVRAAQWDHPQVGVIPGFVQFVGPAHPRVLARHDDLNRDGRADAYDGYFDLELAHIAEEARTGATPRDPGVHPSQVGGEAADGLGWAVGTMNRVVQYSDLWAALAGRDELRYPFTAAGFYDHREPPRDLGPGRLPADPGRLPAACRVGAPDAEGSVELLFHAWLAHAGRELKRALVAAEAAWRLHDAGRLDDRELRTPLARRGLVLLTLAGLLEYPADQNEVDATWSAALRLLRFPELSRSVVRACITQADHDASHYYGSRRGLRQLLAALEAADPVAHALLAGDDPAVGRAAPLDLPT